LPTKTTTKSGTPTIRIQGGIDTPEHIADFESAADHVLTLRKFQELNLRVTLPVADKRRSSSRTSVFDAELDNTTDKSAILTKDTAPSSWLDKSPAARAMEMPQHLRDALEKVQASRVAASGSEDAPADPLQSSSSSSSFSPQTRRRWRYSGPYIAGMNGMEFDTFLKNITRTQKAAFRQLVKQQLINERRDQERAEALEEGRAETAGEAAVEVSEEDVTHYLRRLRSEPGKFGPLIAEFFDLADGPKPSLQTTDPWSYGRDTISADLYRESGPPRTHPSAGLSYLKSEMFSANDVVVGPRETRPPVPGRLLKSSPASHNKYTPHVGVAGFVVPQPAHTAITDFNWKWEPVKDGPKMVVTPLSATVSQQGKLEMRTKLLSGWHLEKDVPVNNAERKVRDGDSSAAGNRRNRSSQLPRLDALKPRRRFTRSRPEPEPSQDISEELDAMMRAASQSTGMKLS
jgi:hypothetical protein